MFALFLSLFFLLFSCDKSVQSVVPISLRLREFPSGKWLHGKYGEGEYYRFSDSYVYTTKTMVIRCLEDSLIIVSTSGDRFSGFIFEYRNRLAQSSPEYMTIFVRDHRDHILYQVNNRMFEKEEHLRKYLSSYRVETLYVYAIREDIRSMKAQQFLSSLQGHWSDTGSGSADCIFDDSSNHLLGKSVQFVSYIDIKDKGGGIFADESGDFFFLYIDNNGELQIYQHANCVLSLFLENLVEVIINDDKKNYTIQKRQRIGKI